MSASEEVERMKEFDYEQFLIYLRKFQNKIQKQFNQEIKKLNLTSTYVGIIMILSRKETGYSMSELSRLTAVDNALMTRNIKELEKINYIYRNREKESQRKYHICLTEEGKNVAESLKNIMEKKRDYLIESFTEEEQEVLEKAGKIVIHRFLNEIGKEEK